MRGSEGNKVGPHNLFPNPAFAQHIKRFLHSQGARAGFFTRVAVKTAGRSHLVSTVQMPVEGYDVNPVKKSIYVALDRFSERFVDKFVVVSKSLEQTLIQKHKIRPDKVVLIYNGIELSEYYPDDFGESFRCIREEYNIGEEVFLIGAVGRMVWQKGFECLIESVPAIIKTFPRAKILIVGDGPLRKNLEALSEELRIRDKVIFTGFRSDIKEILSAIDILVIPSLLEGFPMITLEAMAMAKPIVATKIDGVNEQIMDRIDGILIPPKDPSAIAQAIIRLINDRESGRKLGLAARKRVEQEFSVEKMVAETEKVYLSLPRAG